MTAEEIWQALKGKDIRLALHRDRLRVDAPQGVLTESLKRQLAEHKAALIELICNDSSKDGDQSSGSPVPSAADVAHMPIDDFAQAGLIVEIWSNVLDGKVLLVSDNVEDKELVGSDLPVYRASEMQKLAILRPEPRPLRQIHDVKNIFGGQISDVIPGGQ